MTRPIQQVAVETIPACTSCGVSGDGVHLEEYENPGDPSVGYGPDIEILCDDCANHYGVKEN